VLGYFEHSICQSRILGPALGLFQRPKSFTNSGFANPMFWNFTFDG
jgi:hypothetical protein